MKPGTRNQEQHNERRVWLTRYLPLFIWIGVIFFLSSGQGSMGQTSRIIGPLLEFLFPSASPERILLYHGAIRKLAHFAEYAVLGLFACRAFSLTDACRRGPYLFAVALIVLVAVADETYQSFNPERTGSAIDVGIDVSGGILAVVFCYFFGRWRRQRKLNEITP